MTYWGLVKQSSGEDWTNIELLLSTAKPSVGGRPPNLPSQQVVFATNRPGARSYGRKMNKRSNRMQKCAAPMMQQQMNAAPMVQMQIQENFMQLDNIALGAAEDSDDDDFGN